MIHVFKVDEDAYVLDVESGSVLSVDDESFHVLQALEKGEQPTGEHLDEVLAEIEQLKAQGVLFTEGTDELPQNEYRIKSLCLHIAHDCNLRCTYCFGDKGAFGHERSLMNEEVAKQALDFLMVSSGSRRNLEVDFFGGEPMMNFGVVKEAVEYGRSLEAKHGKNIRFTITTNAYCLPDDAIDFINREMKNVVLSIDGRKEVHDAFRKTASGGGSYDRVVANAREIVKRRTGEYYVRGTFTAKNLDFTDDVMSLFANGFDQLSIEPVVTLSDLAITEDMLPRVFEEYDRLYHAIKKRRAEGEFLNFFHFMIDLNVGPCLNKRIRGCGAANEYAAVAPNGDLYPCHQFVGKKEFLLGSVWDGVVNKDICEKFLNVNVRIKNECANCFAKYFCSGGCAAASYNIEGDIAKNYKVGCAIAKKRLELAIALALS